MGVKFQASAITLGRLLQRSGFQLPCQSQFLPHGVAGNIKQAI